MSHASQTEDGQATRHALHPKLDYAELEKRLGYLFRDRGLLQLALTHPSVAHEQGAPMQTNQRLEFLGDAVLQLVLTRELYEKFPTFGEGPLTKARAKLVNRRTLADHARHLGLGRILIVSRGEEIHGGRERPSALADTFEALLGAIFLDGGFEAAREFILRAVSAPVSAAWQSFPLSKIPRANCRNSSNPLPRKRRSIMSSPLPAPITIASSNAPSTTTAWNSRAVREKARKPPKAKPPCGPGQAEEKIAAEKKCRASFGFRYSQAYRVNNLFLRHKKVLIGVVHLRPLPARLAGTANWKT